MLDNTLLFTVTDLKQYAYCPRVVFYEQCLPHLRPRTFKMDAGRDAHEDEQRRAARRKLIQYGVAAGEREFEVRLQVPALHLTGEIDEIVWAEDGTVFPVDYKLAKRVSSHHKVQLMAYGLLIEHTYDVTVDFGYIYLISKRETVQVPFTTRLRNRVLKMLSEMWELVEREQMPPAAAKPAMCLSCEFRRFCNDV
jgi:CRISPR-associated exonuclease Cas4